MKTVPTTFGEADVDRTTTLPCADPDVVELFFPVGTSGPALQQTAEAKTLCMHCPILQTCRADALARPAHFAHGVVGGLSEDERHAMHRRQARKQVQAR